MWHQKEKEEVLSELHTNLETGLRSEEAKKRLTKYGPNRLAGKRKRTIWERVFAQINNVLIYVLIGAAIISGVVGEIADAAIIGLVVVLNAIVGVVQESKAEQALEELKKMATPKAIVKRDGELQEIPSEEVVPGDIIVLDAGRFVPCDIRLTEAVNLKVEESALTGESVPVDKSEQAIKNRAEEEVPLGDQTNMVFMSTLTTYGRGTGVAVATGMESEIGKIAKMLSVAEDELTPLQKSLEQVGKYLGIAAIIICVIMFLIGAIQGRDLLEMFMTAISLAVAAIPEGLPAIVSIVLAIGVQRMIKQNVIIRKLPAVEALGSVNIICSDKTGTLTQNKMTVTQFYANRQAEAINNLNINDPVQKLLLETLILCNDATYSEESETGDPTEIALLAAGTKVKLIKEELERQHPRLNEIPFDSDRKRMTTVHSFGEEVYILSKGAIDRLLPLCKNILVDGKRVELTDEYRSQILHEAEQMSNDALRVLAAAYKVTIDPHIEMDKMEADLIFIGIVGMIDPPRLEVKDAISKCKNAGIRTVMITGDHKDTAFAIAKELGIASSKEEVMEGLQLDQISEDELAEKINNLNVFARVSPEHKVKIVHSLKTKGNIVSMTGDGVNDAPSLKQADIGVAMGITGTDVAKGAADMVLTDDNFSSIVRAVEEGRNIYRNIKKAIVFLLSCNLGEIFALFLAILLGWSTPLRPIHILWINLITDTSPALALGVDPEEPGVMQEKPRTQQEGLFHGTLPFLLCNGILIGFLTLAAFVIGVKMYASSTVEFNLFIPKNMTKDALSHAQTMAFAVLSFSQLVHSLNLRSMKTSVFKVGIFKNKFLIYSILLGVALQVSIITISPIASFFSVHALNAMDWLIIAGLSMMPLLLNELWKLVKTK